MLDFYEVLKEEKRGGLDPCESRDENDNRLKKAFQFWMPFVNPEADVTKQLITEARIIFGNESNYNRFREWRLKYKLSPFIEGASQDRKLTKEKAEEAKERGKAEGYTDDEVEDLINKELNIEIVDGPIIDWQSFPIFKCDPKAIVFKEGLIFREIIKVGRRKKTFSVENDNSGNLDIKFNVDDPGLLEINPPEIRGNFAELTVTLNTKKAKWGQSYNKKIMVEGNASNCPAEIPIAFKIIRLKKFLGIMIAFLILLISPIIATHIPPIQPPSRRITGIDVPKRESKLFEQKKFEKVLKLADQKIIQEKFEEAENIYIKIKRTYDIDPSYRNWAERKLKEIKGIYLERGHRAKEDHRFKEAAIYYEKAYKIIPDDDTKRKWDEVKALAGIY